MNLQTLITNRLHSKELETQTRQALKPCAEAAGVTVDQLLILDCAEFMPKLIGDIATQCSMHAPAISRMMPKLEAAGLVTVTIDDKDNRARIIEITKKGKRALDKARKLAEGKQ